MSEQVKQSWTVQDEQIYQEMLVRRTRIVSDRERVLNMAVQKAMDSSGMRVDKDDVAGIGKALAFHADAIRDALLPYDSGVRAKNDQP